MFLLDAVRTDQRHLKKSLAFWSREVYCLLPGRILLSHDKAEKECLDWGQVQVFGTDIFGNELLTR